MFIESLAELSLGTRLKLLSDRLYDAIDEVYRQRDAGIESRWFVYLRLLYDRGPLGTTEIASAIGTSHPAVSQLATRLEARGLIARNRDPHDQRRALLALTPKGKRALKELEPVWDAIRESVSAALGRTGHDLMAAVGALESELKSSSLSKDVLKRHARRAGVQVRIEPFKPAWREHFYRLNVAWIGKQFVVEPLDQKILCDPEREIMAKGGRVFFALLGQEVIGTCALELHEPDVYALIKMTVDESYRGLGVGRALMQRALDEFHSLRGRELFLETNAKLTPALTLYESMGFVRQRALRPGSEFARSDVYMIYRDRVRRSRATAKRS